MKSDITISCAACLLALLFFLSPCRAAGEQSCEVAVAALNLPADSSGLVHWRDGNNATMPLQLSTRYFSERVKLRGDAIQFFKDPVLKNQDQASVPEPLVSLKIPAGQKLVYIVLSSEQDNNQQTRWLGNTLGAADWKESSLKLFNACSESLGIIAGKKRIQLPQGKAVDFHAGEWSQSFPVKIVRLQPELKTVFSSTWRVSEGRRELLFIGSAKGTVTLRSLLDLAVPPTSASR